MQKETAFWEVSKVVRRTKHRGQCERLLCVVRWRWLATLIALLVPGTTYINQTFIAEEMVDSF